MNQHPENRILIGIGNSGRSDDGLGWAFVEAVQKKGIFGGDTLLRYQLQVEDAELISQYDQIIFVDAYKGELTEGFSCKSCKAAKDFSFTTHRLPPETIVYLCQELYHRQPETFLLLIAGEKWELEIGLSEKGRQNLQNALLFFETKKCII